jgi:4-amino-4-deoxy-L-arabinose transferase-like glycosyltransferase
MTVRVWQVLALLAAGVVLATAPLPQVDSDAPLYGRIAVNVLSSGDWFTFQHPGWLVDKPPAVFWIMAASFWMGGVSDATMRLWQLLLVLVLAALTGAAARTAGGSREEGWLAALVLMTSVQVFYQATVPQQDVALTACLTLALYALLRYLRDGRHRWAIVAGAAVAAAVLVKGIAGAALFLAAAAAVLLTARRALPHPAPRIAAHAALGAAVVAALAAPWYVHGILQHGDPFVRTFLTTGTLGVGRFFHPAISTPPPYWFAAFAYVPLMALGMLPWTPALAVGLADLPRTLRDRPAGAGAVGAWLIALFLVFSLSSGDKVFRYILPCYPPAAILTAHALARMAADRRRLRAAALAAVPGVAIVAAGVWLLWSAFPAERDRFGPAGVASALGLAAALVGFGAAAWRGRPRAAVVLAAVSATLGHVLFVGAMLQHAPAINPWPQIARAAARDAPRTATVVLYGLGEAFNFAHFHFDTPVAVVDGPAHLAAFWSRGPTLVVTPAERYEAVVRALSPPHIVVFRNTRLVALTGAQRAHD